MTRNESNEKQNLMAILIFQIVTVPIVVLFFRFISPAKVAALYAGGLFILFGFFSLKKISRQPQLQKYPLAWLLFVHIFLISIPMISVRLLNWTADFAALTIWGLPAPLFHSLSSGLYVIIFAVTAFRFWQVRK